MQSVPVYFPHNYSPTSPYPTTTTATATTTTTTTTSSPGTGSTVMTISNPPLLATPNGMTPLEQSMLRTASSENTTTTTVKRNQVKNACTNCQKACKKCDDARPCPRCIKYGISDTCINSVRKERKKGIKRGPYKRRQKSNDDTKSGTNTDNLEGQQQQYTIRAATGTPTTASPTATTATATNTIPATTDYGYPTNLTQYTQAYDPYHYAATATAVYNNTKDGQGQGQQGVYIVNAGYPMYPLVNGNNSNNNNTTSNNDDAANNNYLSGILHQAAVAAAASSNASSPSLNNPPPAPGVYYQQPGNDQTTTTTTTTTEGQETKHQPMTPVPSTSNSSGTTSPSETAVGDDEDSKFARLTQLCSAALRENKEAEAAAAAAAAAIAAATSGSNNDTIKEEPN